MTIEVNLKNNRSNYVFVNVAAYSDLTWDPKWFWVKWADGETRRYIATSEIQDILIQE